MVTSWGSDRMIGLIVCHLMVVVWQPHTKRILIDWLICWLATGTCKEDLLSVSTCHPAAVTLQNCNACWHPFLPHQAPINSSAQMVYSTSKYKHITPLLTQLNWLKKPSSWSWLSWCTCLHLTAPSYITDKFHQWSDAEACRHLHSALSSSLVRRTHLSTIVTELFRSQLPSYGTLCCRTSCRRRHWLFLQNVWRHTFTCQFSQSPVLAYAVTS